MALLTSSNLVTGCVTRVVYAVPDNIDMICEIGEDTPWTLPGTGDYYMATCVARDGNNYEFILPAPGGV